MKQILQQLNTGKIEILEIPCSKPSAGQLLIQSKCSLISAGTERMLLNFGKAGLIGKIKQQPDKVKQVLEKVKTDGLFTTIEAVKSKLDQPIPLGYCNVGRVLEVGSSVEGFMIGDRVLSNGAHAELVRVPKNLCVKIPDSVADESAVFGVLGAIGLQGIRLAQPTLGESVVVLGLGLIGLLTVQLLQAQGCRILGADFDPAKLALAKQYGAETVDLSQGEDVLARALAFSRGHGVDVVLITASTKSSDPVHQAALMCRKRGRIVLVGVTGLELSREDFFKKELSFQVSCSYGPGRYDPEYEDKGHDYPIGFVRWTEQRNIEAVLDMMAACRIDVQSLISHRFSIDQAEQAYQALDSDPSVLGIVLNYPQVIAMEKQVLLSTPAFIKRSGAAPVAAFIGAGNYASRMLIPAFKKAGIHLHSIVSGQGVSAVVHGKKNGFEIATTDYETVLQNSVINTVVIATRPNQHAQQTIQALKAGKHVFVEKPLAIHEGELQQISTVYQETAQQFPGQKLMVGFNRRFSPQVRKIKQLLNTVKTPKYLVMMVNAGFMPDDNWTHDPQIGGGRFISEGCHFIDLLRFLVGATITDTQISAMSPETSIVPKNQNITVTLKFADGSLGTVHYFANSHKRVSKERLEISAAGKVLQLDNFRKLVGYGWTGFGKSGFSKMSLWKQDKGQSQAVKAFVDAIQNGTDSPIVFEELFEVSNVCLELNQRLMQSGKS